MYNNLIDNPLVINYNIIIANILAIVNNNFNPKGRKGEKQMKNLDIRQDCKESGVYLWQVAEYIGVCEMTLSRKLRRELPDEEKAKIRNIIAQLKAEQEGK